MALPTIQTQAATSERILGNAPFRIDYAGHAHLSFRLLWWWAEHGCLVVNAGKRPLSLRDPHLVPYTSKFEFCIIIFFSVFF